jgi:hypothetical protein
MTLGNRGPDEVPLRIFGKHRYEEVHSLTRESGGWRIRGNAGETPRVLPFGTAPHPLF